MENLYRKVKDNWIIIFSVAISIIIYFLISELLSLNLLYGTDVNVWKYIANMIQDGRIIYKDLFDHKGPILYLFYYLFRNYTIISELVIFIVNEIFIYKITKIVLSDKYTKLKSIIVTAISMIILFITLEDFPNTESYSIPFILISLYYFVKNLILKYNAKSFAIIGFCMSIVLFLRANIIVLWIIIYLYFITKMIIKRKIKELFRLIGYTILGMSICIVPIVIYLIHNNILKEFIEYYLIFNLKYASVSTQNDIWETCIYFFTVTLCIHPIIIFINIVLIFLKKNIEDRKLLIINLIYYIVSIYIVISPKREYLHYAIILMPCVIIPLSMLIKNKYKYKLAITIGIELYLALIVFGIGYYNIKYKKENLQKYLLKIEIIADWLKENTQEDDNILVLGNENIIYNLSERNYKGKFFYQFPVIYNSDDIANKFLQEIKEQMPEYIIVNKYKINNDNNIDREISKILEEQYIQIEEYVYRRK